MITEKNKEEIEKILKGCNLVFDYCKSKPCGKIDLCYDCKLRAKATIKTSIQWCEAWLKVTTLQPLHVLLRIHLNWLKEQEKDLK